MFEGNFFYIIKFLPILALTALLFAILGWWLRCKINKCGATKIELENERKRAADLERELKTARANAENCNSELSALKSAPADTKQDGKLTAENSALKAEINSLKSSLAATAAAANTPSAAAPDNSIQSLLSTAAPAIAPGTKLPEATEILGKKIAQDDLKIIEGIGPKIAELLIAKSINTWQALAETKPERIKEILTEAGDRFKMHEPGTWPKQSALAANAQWAELRTLQDRLDGGREPS